MSKVVDAALARTEEVMRVIRHRIERRALTPGARLPSVRAMAETTGFSKSTVVEAYERLVAEGVIRSRAGSGFFVAAPLAPLALADIGPPVAQEIDPLWMLRNSLAAASNALKPGCGWLPDAWMAEDTIRKGLRLLARGETSTGLVGYGSAAGPEGLRRLIARRLVDQGSMRRPTRSCSPTWARMRSTWCCDFWSSRGTPCSSMTPATSISMRCSARTG